jgi:hypothetical protein
LTSILIIEDFYRAVYYYEKIVVWLDLTTRMFYTTFFIVIVCLGVVYEYESILIILINIILLINMKFTIKYH